MKTYVDMTKTQLKRECAKIIERVTGIKPQMKQIVLLEAVEDCVYFKWGNITIDHRDHTPTGVHEYVEIIEGKGCIRII